MNALATLFVGVVTVGVIGINYFMLRAQRRRNAGAAV
jgi:putrescine transport system permease protein